MKKAFKLVFGLCMPIVLAILLMVLFRLAGIYTITAVVALFIAQVVVCALLFFFLKDKLQKWGVVCASIPVILFFAIGIYSKLEQSNAVAPTSKKIVIPSGISDLGLVEYIRASSADLTEEYGDSTVFLTADFIDAPKYPNKTLFNTLGLDLERFHLDPSMDWVNAGSSHKFEILNDTLFQLEIPGRNPVTKKLNPLQNIHNSITYLGYLPQHQLFVFKETVNEYGPDYSCIDALTGQILEGVPLYKSKNGLYANVSFKHIIGDLLANTQVWKKEGEIYELIYNKELDLNTTTENADFALSHIEWDNDDFTYYLYLNEEEAAVTVRLF
jgi:hypothetical protein